MRYVVAKPQTDQFEHKYRKYLPVGAIDVEPFVFEDDDALLAALINAGYVDANDQVFFASHSDDYLDVVHEDTDRVLLTILVEH
jgi:hypothetical protein